MLQSYTSISVQWYTCTIIIRLVIIIYQFPLAAGKRHDYDKPSHDQFIL